MPRRIQSKGYVADTPGPAILGLPSCKRLKVVTLNCAVRITHETPVTLDHTNNGMDWHAETIQQKSGRIISREQLILKYPDCFKGVSRFPGTYKIHLKKGGNPVIHPQQKWPIEMCDILKKKLAWMEGRGTIRHQSYRAYRLGQQSSLFLETEQGLEDISQSKRPQ